MIKEHFDAVERGLKALSEIPSNAGHSIHLGTPREAFISHFLRSHIGAHIAIGTGEVINQDSIPGEKRNQHDVVLHRADFPSLDFGGDVKAFLAQSVISTVEVKSTLNKVGLKNAIKASANTKKLRSKTEEFVGIGYHPPGIVTYLVAYDGPKKMKTVVRWIREIMIEERIPLDNLSTNDTVRQKRECPVIDGVFILGRGFVYFDNVPIGIAVDMRKEINFQWLHSEIESGSLFLFWMLLTSVISGTRFSQVDLSPYLLGIPFGNVDHSHWIIK